MPFPRPFKGLLKAFTPAQAVFFLPISLVIFFVEWSRGTRRAPVLTIARDAKAEHARRVEKVAADVKHLGTSC